MIPITLSLLLTLFSPWRLFYFAPLLVHFSYRKSLSATLWIAFSCGLVIDLMSPYSLSPLHSLAYCLTTFAIYPLRKRFFEDRLFTLPLLTVLFSIGLSLIQLVLVALFQGMIHLSWGWAFTDLLFLPILDAIYGFSLYVLGPNLLRLRYGRTHRR